MKNFLYKLIFPFCNKLYVGKALSKNRYNWNKPNTQFIGPHHNVEVQKLLDQGEFCFFYVVKEFETPEELEEIEDSYLKKVWPNDDWESRPRWLMNRKRSAQGGARGDLHHNRKQEHRTRISEQSLRLHQEGKIPLAHDFHGKPWKNDDPRRHYNPDEVFKIVEKKLIESNWKQKWGRKKLSQELQISEITLKRIAGKVRNKWKH